MLISMVKGEPALFIKRESVLVVGDLHIGLDLKYKESGILFPNATERMASDLRRLCKKTGARSVVLLGDVKESIAYPRFAEFMELKRFFEALKDIRISIVKGNHDGDLAKVLASLGLEIPVEKEIFVDGVALVHGNAWPSEGAMQKRYLVSAHTHFAIDAADKTEKAWLIAKAGKRIGERYKRYNKKIKLVVMPPFNDLILGTRIDESRQDRMPLFRQEAFGWKSAEARDLGNRLSKRI